MRKVAIILTLLLILFAKETLVAQDTVELPDPQTKLGVDVLEAMQNRHSTREYSENSIDIDDLSTILWAAYGINRPESDLKTVPIAMGIDYGRVYVFDADGVWKYEPEKSRLLKVLDGDHREEAGKQGFVGTASHVLLLTADLDEYSLLKGAVVSRETKIHYAHATAGCMTQNIALAAESMGIGSVMVAWFSPDKLSEMLDLDKDEIPLYLIPLGKHVN